MTVGLWPGIVGSLEGVSIPANIGDSAYGGYYAGIIDTTRSGSIDVSDDFQAGLRYLLIISPKSLEIGKGTYAWDTLGPSNGPTGVRTRWNGLEATTAMYNGGSNFEAATYCYNLSFPGDGHSRWYLPAMDELELLYRNFKPLLDGNYTVSSSTNAGTFPFNGLSYVSGGNISSDPTGSVYTFAVPARTSLSDFQIFGSQALDGTANWFLSSTEYASATSWMQQTGTAGQVAGLQTILTKTSTTGSIRPVRRVLL